MNRIIIIGRMAIAGEAKIWKMNPMAMKVMATPARAERSAARGVWRRNQSPTNAPAVSISPLIRQANRPTCQTSVGFPVSW